MWNFTSGGALMPSLAPLHLADPFYTHDGKFELQVRARQRSHITNFIRDFMEDGTYGDIEETAWMDYPFRFYTTREAYGDAMKKAVLAIDYISYKHTTEDKNADGTPKYADGKAFHGAAMAVWSALYNKYGGYWGYDKNGNYVRHGSYLKDGSPKPAKKWEGVGSSFGSRSYTPSTPSTAATYTGRKKSWDEPLGTRKPARQGALWDDLHDDFWDAEKFAARNSDDGIGDYTTSREAEADAIYDNYKELPLAEVKEWLTVHEWGLLEEFYPKHVETLLKDAGIDLDEPWVEDDAPRKPRSRKARRAARNRAKRKGGNRYRNQA